MLYGTAEAVPYKDSAIPTFGSSRVWQPPRALQRVLLFAKEGVDAVNQRRSALRVRGLASVAGRLIDRSQFEHGRGEVSLRESRGEFHGRLVGRFENSAAPEKPAGNAEK